MNRRYLLLTIGAALAKAQSGKAMVLILIGPPGSGKTVQAKYLSRRYRVPAISAESLVKEELGRRTPTAKALGPAIASGELIGDEPLNDLIKNRLLRPDASRGFILDGYPMSPGQAQALDEFLKEHQFPTPFVVLMEVPDEVLRQRMAHRKRVDDDPATIERRIKEYRAQGKLVPDWYGKDVTLQVDGTGEIEVVSRRIQEQIDRAGPPKALKTREKPVLQQR